MNVKDFQLSLTTSLNTNLKGLFEPEAIVSALESISSGEQNQNDIYTTIEQELLTAGLESIQNEYRMTPEQKKISTKAAVLAILASKFDGEVEEADGLTVDGSGQQAAALEALADHRNTETISASATMAALSVSLTSGIESAFPTKVLKANESALVVSVEQPEIYTRVTRSSDGKPMDLSKSLLIDALYNPDILDHSGTNLVPVVAAEHAAMLVDVSDETNASVTVGGAQIDTRSIKTGIEVDLIKVCTSTSLLSGGVLDFTDELDENTGVATLSLKLTNGANSASFKVDVADQATSLFVPSTTGDEYIANLNAFLSAALPAAIVGNADLVLPSALTGANLSDLRVVIDIKASGHINRETSSGVVFGNSAVVKSIYNTVTKQELGSSTVAAVNAAVDIEIFGWAPSGNRLNSNLRSARQMIDSGKRISYKLPARVRAPIETVSPANGAKGRALTPEQLRRLTSTRQLADIGRVIIRQAALLANGSIGARNSLHIGSQMVKPHLFKPAAAINLATLVQTNTSENAYGSYRAAITSAITVAGARMLTDSNWFAAKMHRDGTTEGTGLIVFGDQFLCSLIGDTATAGDNTGRKFSIKTVPMYTSAFAGKLFIVPTSSVSGSGNDGVDILNFGVHVFKPAQLVEFPRSENGTNVRVAQIQPNDDYYALCPVMAELTFTGQETLLVNVAPAT